MSNYFKDVDIPRPPELGGGVWHIARCSDITIVFGRNGSGKSLLLRAWRDQSPESLHYILPERTGEISFEAGLMQHQQSGEGRRGQSQGNFINNYRQQVIARITTFLAARGNVRGDALRGDPDELEILLGVLIPDFHIALTSATPPYVLTRAATGVKVENVQQLSSGEAQLVTIGLDILTMAATWDLEGKETRVLLIDEPDAHIHPDLQVRFADFLVQVVDKFSVQTVVATHSTTLLSALGQFGGERAAVAYLSRGSSQIVAQSFDKALKKITACLGGHALMGPMFGAPLLLVEGDDDYRIWSQVPRHQIANFSVIPCNGDEIRKYQRALEQVLSAFAEEKPAPMGYVLLDGDKSLPRLTNKQVPQAYVRYLRLQCHEAENLYVTDEVLSDLGLTWGDAVARLRTQAKEYLPFESDLKAAQSWDRRNIDLHQLIVPISQVLDDKRVHWTVRVGQRLGRSRPQGQLADFLGESVLASLWPIEST